MNTGQVLIDYHDEILFLNGQAVPESLERIALVAKGWAHYEPISPEEEQFDHKQAINIDLEGNVIQISGSWFGEFPLFYFADKGRVIISHSIPDVMNALSSANYQMALDEVGVYESMIFDSPLRSRTVWKDVHKIIAGQKVEIDLRTGRRRILDSFILPFWRGDGGHNEKKLLETAKGIMESLLDTFQPSLGSRNVVPLSGGLDSRLLSCLMHSRGTDFQSFVFGPPESSEVFVARKVMKSMGRDIDHFRLNNSFYKKYGQEVTLITGGMSNHKHCHFYAYFTDNQMTFDNLLHGHMGCVYAGDFQPDFGKDFQMSESEAYDRFLDKYARRFQIWALTPQIIRDEIMGDLEIIMKDNCKKNFPCHFDEYTYAMDRQFSLISNIFCITELFGKVIRPFANKDYCLFFNTLPFRLREDRYLFRKASKSLFPTQFSIGTQQQIYPRASFLGILERLISRSLSSLNRTSYLLTQGRMTIPNPKNYERHQELLHTTLREDYFHAVDRVSDFLNVDLGLFKVANSRNQIEVTTQYRILSTATLLNAFDL